ncbi:hypothetical protein [Clostridium sp. KNHs205]|uniref:hypothetical protein n=1 Tax=Clostridium sp. KNHs205 TaxID=1449050 RepID=UPI00051B8E0E|nr:hypothetical protein [Clostridium sp. KNHs205]
MNNRYFVKFEYRNEKMVKIFEFKTRRDALDYFRLFYQPDSEDLYYSIFVSECDADQKTESLLALLTFVERNVSGEIIRKNWRNWNVGRVTIYETYEFDGDSITQGILTEVHSDHAILTADGMHLWIDDDTQFMFR